jgi:hypothetical protein
MTDPQRALLDALEAAGLSIQSPEEREMFTTLSDEQVTQMIELRARTDATDSPAAEADPTPASADPPSG